MEQANPQPGQAPTATAPPAAGGPASGGGLATNLHNCLMMALGHIPLGNVETIQQLIPSTHRLIAALEARTPPEALRRRKYLAGLRQLADALTAVAELVDDCLGWEFEGVQEKKDSVTARLQQLVPAFDDLFAASPYWKASCLFLVGHVELLVCQAAFEEALCAGDFKTCVQQLGECSRRCAQMPALVAAIRVAFANMVAAPTPQDPVAQIMFALLEQQENQYPRLGRILEHKARRARHMAAVAARPSWKMQLAFLLAWLLGIGVVSAIAHWTNLRVSAAEVFGWSALGAGVAAGLLKLQELAAIWKTRGTDPAPADGGAGEAGKRG